MKKMIKYILFATLLIISPTIKVEAIKVWEIPGYQVCVSNENGSGTKAECPKKLTEIPRSDWQACKYEVYVTSGGEPTKEFFYYYPYIVIGNSYQGVVDRATDFGGADYKFDNNLNISIELRNTMGYGFFGHLNAKNQFTEPSDYERVNGIGRRDVSGHIEYNSSGKITSCPDIYYSFSTSSSCIAAKEFADENNRREGNADIGEKPNKYGAIPISCGAYYEDTRKASGTPIGGLPTTNENSGSTNNASESNKADIEKYNCNTILTPGAIELVKKILGYIQFLVPVVLIVMISTDMIRAVIAQDDKQMKAAYAKSVKRIIAAIAVFIIPFFVIILFKIPEIRKVLENSGIVENPLCIGTESPPDEKEDPVDEPEPEPEIKEPFGKVGDSTNGYLSIPSDWTKNSSGTWEHEYKDKNNKLGILFHGEVRGSGEEARIRAYEANYCQAGIFEFTLSGTTGYKITCPPEDNVKRIYYYLDKGTDDSKPYMYEILIVTDANDTEGLEKLVESTFKTTN